MKPTLAREFSDALTRMMCLGVWLLESQLVGNVKVQYSSNHKLYRSRGATNNGP